MKILVFIFLIVILGMMIKNIYGKYIQRKQYLQMTKGLTRIISLDKWKESVRKAIKEELNELNDEFMIDYAKKMMLDGKHLRSLIPCYIGEKENIQSNELVAIEFIHNASLILDDIMDKDMMRRGKPTLHVIYGQEIALLMMYELIIIGLSLLYKVSINVRHKDMFMKVVKSNLMNLVRGQIHDIRKSKELDIIDLFKLKTSTLFKLSFSLPLFMKEESSKQDIENILNIGECFGILFQIHDDYMDIYDDMKKGNQNIILRTGNVHTYTIAKKYYEKARELTKTYNKDILVIENILKDIYENIESCHRHIKQNNISI